ncbi:efflux RND transporter periplasmic adaptor subunit [Rhizomicrobium palustre]
MLANAVLEPVRMVNVGAQVTGQIRALHVGLNQRVKAGDLIAEIDSLPQRNALRIAEASLANISAQQKARTIQYAQAENEFRRQKNLLSEQATSRSAFDAAKASYMALEAEVKALTAQMTQARVEVENAQVNLGYTRIVAPIDGVVIAVVTKQGQTLNSTQSVPTIVVLAQLDVMRLKIQISEADVTRVQPGQKVWFNVIGDQNTKRMTTLRLIETAPTTMASDGGAQTTAQSTAAIYYNGLGEIPNPDGKLRPQMTAQANIVLRTATNVLMVPWPALKERGADGRYRVGAETAGGKVQTRFVRIGASDKVNVQIRDGLSLGEKVVIGTAAPAPMDSPL